MNVVALGGGHGTSVTLSALNRLNVDFVGVVSVADDGGSTGVLRELLGIAGVGDLRKCLAVLAANAEQWAPLLEFRFEDDELGHHALGNLLLAASIASSNNLEESIQKVSELLAIRGRLLPASSEAVELEADTDDGVIRGQVAIARETGVSNLRTVPESVAAPRSVIEAIEQADFVLIGPGSLITSVIAACVVPGIREALKRTSATKIWLANLKTEYPETSGWSVRKQLKALQDHEILLDLVLLDERHHGIEGTLDVVVESFDLASGGASIHDPAKLSRALEQVMAN